VGGRCDEWVVEVEVWGDGVGLVVGWWWVDVCVGRGKGEKGRGQEEEESGEE